MSQLTIQRRTVGWRIYNDAGLDVMGSTLERCLLEAMTRKGLSEDDIRTTFDASQVLDELVGE